MRLVIRGTDLPGTPWKSAHPLDVEPRNVFVGIQLGREPAQTVAADEERATFTADLTVVRNEEGLDFRGPAVQGRRGERFVYLTWGDVGVPGSFEMFRRAKLMLAVIDPAIIAAADRPGQALIADLGLTDDEGGPLCARVVPPVIRWSAGPA